MEYKQCYKYKIMDKELQDKLEIYAKERADEVFDIDIDELRQLVIDGAKWLIEQQEE